MSSTEPGFSVSVDGAFDEAGVWVIDSEVAFREDLADADRKRLVGDIRLALLAGIVREARQGKMLGATKVRVELDDPARRWVRDLPPGLETPQ